MKCKAAIQGRKFYDVNENGEFDNEEKDEEGNPNRLNGRHINLYDDEWNLIDWMETGDDGTAAGNVGKGQYRFVGLDLGTYYVCEELQEGWEQSRPYDGMTDAVLWGDPATYCFEVTITSEGQTKAGRQFGNYPVIELIPVCGNGIVEVGETCDDNNTESDDGCDSSCQEEEIVTSSA